MRISINKLLKAALECLHITMVSAMLVLALYTVRKFRIEEMVVALFFGAFFILIPVLVLRAASHRCKKDISYVLIFAMTLAGVYKAAQIVGAEYLYLNVRRYYLVMMMILTVAIGVMFLLMRRGARQRLRSVQMRDASWEDDFLLPDIPRLIFVIWFVGVYILAQITACPKGCSIALFSGIAYVALAVIYTYLAKKETYLKLNEKTCGVKNIPVRRMRTIGRQFLLINLLLIFLAMIPALVSMSGRSYIDVRNWTNPYKETEIIYPPEMLAESAGVPEEAERTFFTKILELVIKAVAPVLVATTMVFLFYLIMQGFDAFAGEAEPENDRIESLNEEDEVVYSFEKHQGKMPGDHKIRRAYRKFIRKHREDIPGVFETPYEIEVAAGVVHTEEMKRLHDAYERVRYTAVCGAQK